MAAYLTPPFLETDYKLATDRANTSAAGILDRAKRLQEDPQRAERLAEQECRSCFYLARGGMVQPGFTKSDCVCCSKTMEFSTTRADRTCMPCAHEHQLCKRCGGDIEMNKDRTHYPSQTPQTA